MGMFDDIIVPKSYLRGLLDKKQEKLLKGNHAFQTKSLDNTLSRYKVYAQRLYKLERSVDMGGGIETWRKLDNTVIIVFYDTVKDKKENEKTYRIWQDGDCIVLTEDDLKAMQSVIDGLVSMSMNSKEVI